MKKTLIALAAVASLATSGAAFAQATISGQLGFSWQQSPVIKDIKDGSHPQGLSMNDGDIYLTAKEDLGGGMSATARGGFTMRGRGTAIADRDGTISLAGPMGSVTVGNLRSCGPLDAVKSGAVTGTVYTANETENAVPLDKCSLVDVVTYTAPKFGDFTLAATYGEFNNAAGTNQKGNVTGLTFTVLGATYASGPFMATGDVTTYAAATSANQSSGLKALDGWMRTRAAGTYDMGAAKFGLGYQTWTWGKADQMLASVAIPVQNMVFGIDYMARGAQGAATKGSAADNEAFESVANTLGSTRNGDAASSAVGVGVTYNFSKTVSLNASYITYTDVGVNSKYGTPVAAAAQVMNNAAVGVAPTVKTAAVAANPFPAGTTPAAFDTEYRVRLLKTF